MPLNNHAVEAIIASPEKYFFRLEHLMPPDQMQIRSLLVLTIHHRHERSYGNAWVLNPNKKPARLIKEIIFHEQPKETHLFTVLALLSASIESSGIRPGRVGELYLSHFNSQIQELLEKRAKGIFTSLNLKPLEKAKKIYDLIVFEGMEAKFLWVQQIHELAFDGGAVTLFDAGLCTAALYHAQMKSDPGRKYIQQAPTTK